MAEPVQNEIISRDTTGTVIHLILQGKRGVGKRVVATWLAQYLLKRGKNVHCIDSDPVNRSLAQYCFSAVQIKNQIGEGDPCLQKSPKKFETEAHSRPPGVEFEMAYQVRVAIDRIRFAIKHTEQFVPSTAQMREASLQLLDALQRLETVERRFQDRSRKCLQPRAERGCQQIDRRELARSDGGADGHSASQR